jgi:DNA-binding phage protein
MRLKTERQEASVMARTKPAVPFDEIVEARVGRESGFAADLLQEAAQCVLGGELEAARNLIRNVIKGSIGYAKLSASTGTPETSLIRMFGPNGNPTAENLSAVFVHLQRLGGVRLRVGIERAPPRKRRAA